ncbi:energy transducer TonB [Brevundimonas sp.]|uniref:energy transducer TonB n=1 Tax=Brevundimonas sp. TaxID=1871086 RepID=UPI001855C8A7|nr:energy transducer TonB [Brevundimonas sp.]MBA4807025.1 energy transducer TonB [Brevundimonas sp.]
MTDVEYHRSRYDAPKTKGFMGVSYPVLMVCLLVVTILFALLIFFLQQSKFKLKEFNYVDESVEVELVEPVPPPPAPPAPPRPPVISNPRITRQPDLARFYPDRALEREQSGRTVLECQVETNGSLTNCSVVSESPAGAGFGQAALRAVRTMRIEPAMRDGQPVVGRATIPINWRLG